MQKPTAVDAFIQVRRGSTRLPDKAFAPLGEASCIEHVVRRLKRCSLLREIIICTSELPEDDALVGEARRLGVQSFQGSLDDCLDRFSRCAQRFQTEIIVRVGGDSPLVCPELIDRGIESFVNLDCDYMGSQLLPVGTYFEIFSVQALERAATVAVHPENSADLTYFVGREEINRTHQFEPPEEYRRKDVVLALNRPEDLEVLSEIFTHAPREEEWLTLKEALRFLDARPDLRNRNSSYIPVSSAADIQVDPTRLTS